jgi:hypothetical protein
MYRGFSASSSNSTTHTPGRGNRQQRDEGEAGTLGPIFTLVVADPEVAERVREKLAARKGGAVACRVGPALDEDEGRTGW